MSPSTASSESEVLFTSLGMFIIDEIHYPPPTPPQFNVAGGAGTYSAVGARLFCPPPLSRGIGCIVDVGDDFPNDVRATLNAWETGCLMRTREGPTTRGWNSFNEDGVRAFRYMTPKIRLDAADLSPPLLAARSFHLICPSRRCMSMVKNIISARAALPSSPSHQAVFIWEPVPDMCTPSELQNCYQACKSVDVISPNDGELLSFFGEDNVGISERWTLVEKRAEDFLRSGVGENQEGAVVVRAGGKGCYVAVLSRDIGVIGRWLPAYHQDASKVADPTGGGNGFLGGFAVGLIRSEKEHGTEKFIEAATYGSVAASFCIEQVGVPRLESYRQGQELWNGVKPFERLNDFQSRTNGNEAREKVH